MRSYSSVTGRSIPEEEDSDDRAGTAPRRPEDASVMGITLTDPPVVGGHRRRHACQAGVRTVRVNLPPHVCPLEQGGHSAWSI